MTKLKRTREMALKIAVYSGRRRAEQLGLLANLTLVQWDELLKKAEGKCSYCKEYVGDESLTVDHIIPMAKGGNHTIDNVTPACFDCNVKKTAVLLPDAFPDPKIRHLPFHIQHGKGKGTMIINSKGLAVAKVYDPHSVKIARFFIAVINAHFEKEENNE